MKYLLPILLIFTLYNCETEPVLATLEQDYQLKDTIEIPFQSIVSISTENLQIGFQKVIEESRCPHEWDCLWKGNSTIALSVQKGDGIADIELTAQGRCDEHCGNVVQVGQYNIQLLDIFPYPDNNNYSPQSNTDNYSVVVIVTKESNHLPAAIGIQS